MGFNGLFLNQAAYETDVNIVSNVTYQWMDVLEAVFNALHKYVTVINMSSKEIINFLPEFKGVLEGDKGKNMIFDNSKLRRIVPSFKETISLKQGIKNTVSFLEKETELQEIDYSWDGRIDWMISRYCKKHGVHIDSRSISIFQYDKISFKDGLRYITSRYRLFRSIKRFIHK